MAMAVAGTLSLVVEAVALGATIVGDNGETT